MLKKDLQVEDLYKDVEAIPKDIRFLAGMCNLVWIKGAEYLEPTKEEKCFKENPLPPDFKESPTQYANNSFEYLMWMTSLISMCWLLTNVRKKTEDGHCHNPIHDKMKEQTDHPKCHRGSECHSKFYDNVLEALDRLVMYAKENRPRVINRQITEDEDDDLAYSR